MQGGQISEFEMRSQMRMQLDIVKLCFGDCVQNFRDAELASGEKSCLQNCAKRSIGSLMILGEVQQSMMARQGGMGGQF